MIAIGTDRFRSKAAASPESGSGSGGHVEDFSKRLGDVEKAIVEVRTKLDAALPHLATKADLHSAMHATETRLGATETRLSAAETRLGAALHAMEVRMITWMIATSISAAAAAFAIAKYFN